MRTLTFLQALEQAEVLARQSLDASLHERLSAAYALVKQGSVFQDDAGHWTVASATTEGKRYSVNGACSCEDAFYQAPQGRCKHKLAQLLARKVHALLQVSEDASAEAAQPAQEPPSPTQTTVDTSHSPDASPALPEAPASVNVHILLEGRQVQLTLRDSDETRLLQRLTAVLQQYPIPEGSSSAQAAQAPEPPLCKYHGAMKASTKAPGTFFCTKKLADGSYCPSRFPER